MKRMKKLTVILLAMIMVFSLAACGGGAKDDPNLGKYIGDEINIFEWTPMEEVYPGDNFIELKADGKGDFTMDGENIEMKWSLDGDKITIVAEDVESTGTLKDGVLTIDVFFGVEMPMTFIKEGAKAPDQEEKEEPKEEEKEEPKEEEKEEPKADTGYGKSTEDATGFVDFETLKTGFSWLKQQTGNEGGYLRPTYEEIKENFGGVDGMKDHVDSWKDDYHVYMWKTEDGKEFALLSFKVDQDGNETWNSSSWSNGLNE